MIYLIATIKCKNKAKALAQAIATTNTLLSTTPCSRRCRFAFVLVKVRERERGQHLRYSIFVLIERNILEIYYVFVFVFVIAFCQPLALISNCVVVSDKSDVCARDVCQCKKCFNINFYSPLPLCGRLNTTTTAARDVDIRPQREL